MIIRRADFIAALQRLKLDKPSYGHIGDQDPLIIALYARRLLPVLVQAEALFWESGGDVSTPARAALALALHQADPAIFHFPDCSCSPMVDRPCKPDCAREAYLDGLRWRARTPLAIKPALITRLRQWWAAWRM